MKILTVKIKSKKLLIVFLIILILFIFLLEFISVNSKKFPQILDNEQRVNFIKGLNLNVSEEPIEQKQIIIPEKFSDVYLSYNQIQLSAGYDLSLYKGKTADLYKYFISEENGDKKYVNLIIFNGKVIGGDISTIGINGYMSPLKEQSN